MNESIVMLSNGNSSHSQALISSMNASSETSTGDFLGTTPVNYLTTQEVDSGDDGINYIWTLTGMVSKETYLKVRKIFRLYIRITLSLIGMCTNTASLVVIIRDNPKKSSNILLMALAFGDLVYTCSTLNIMRCIYFFWDDSRPGYYFSPTTNLALYYMLTTNYVTDSFGYFVSVTMPLMITGERIIAIFFPLKFTSIVTTRRTVFAVVAVFTYALAFSIPNFFEVVYYTYPNSTRMRLTSYGGLRTNNPHYQNYSLVTHYISGYIYLALVIIGTTVIGVKIRMISEQRKKLASGSKAGEKSSGGISRTTKTLLSVSILYCVSNVLILIMEEVRGAGRTYNDDILIMVIQVIAIINSSCNFFIYVFFNKKFRSQFSFKKSRGSRMGMSTKGNTE